MNDRGGLLERGRLACHCLLIEGPIGLTLVDTGIGTGAIRHPEDQLPGKVWTLLNGPKLDIKETAIRQVKALGFAPEDVRSIVLTHLDFDHAGGLADFPMADVYVFADELEAATHPTKKIDHARYHQDQWAHGPCWRPCEVDGERWFGFRAVRAIDNDIALIPLPGHTAGHCGVAIRRPEGGWLLHAGDAAFWHGEVEAHERECPKGLQIYQNVFQWDKKLRLQNGERLRDLARRHGDEVTIITSHDPFTMDLAEQVESPASRISVR